MARYDDSGPEVPWNVKAGDPIVQTWAVTDTNSGAAITVSGATATGKITDIEGSATLYSLTMTYPTASSVKAKYAAGISTPGRYWWSIRVLMADGETVYRGQGLLTVEAA